MPIHEGVPPLPALGLMPPSAPEPCRAALCMPWLARMGCRLVLPLPLALLDPTTITWAAVLLSFATRLVLALRFRQSLVGVLLHPLSVLALLVVQWTSLLRELRGRPSTWRGRAYPAG